MPQIGRVLDHYRLLEPLGEGGMGVVWLAEDTRLGRKVALKFLPPEAASDHVRRERFEREARAAAALSHPAIATVHELAESEGQNFIVFEYVPGCTLRSLLPPAGLPTDELLGMASEIADALSAAHAADVIHRDLKPENVMRTPAGGCKILDFGLARISAGSLEPTRETRSQLTAGMVVGTVGYMAPEQLEGKEVDFRADIFAFGTLLYELATGVHPFQAGSSASTIANILTAEPPPLTQRNRLHPPELERIVRKCLRKRRDERYQSTRDLAVDLRNLKSEFGESPRTLAAVTLAPPAAEQETLLGAVFSHMGVNARRLWQLHCLMVALVYVPLIAYLVVHAGAIAATAMKRVAQGREVILFFLFVATLIATAGIRLYEACLSVFLPGRLELEVRRLQSKARALDFALAVLVTIAWQLFLRSGAMWEHGGVFAAMVASSVAIAVAAAWIEPALDRAAFPRAFAEADRDRTRTLRLGMAAAQVFYILPLFMPLAAGKFSFDASFVQVMQRVNRQPSAAQFGMFAYLLIAVLGSIALFVSAVQLLGGGVPAVREFRRRFLAYLSIYVFALAAWTWFLLESEAAVVGALMMLGVLASLPAAQWKLINQALRESGEREPVKQRSRPGRVNLRTWWWYGNIFDCVVAFPFVGYLAWLGWQRVVAGLIEAGADVAWANAIFIAVIIGAGLNVASRVTLLGFASFEIPDFAVYLQRYGVWQRLSMWIVGAGLAALAIPLSETHVGLAATLAALAIVLVAGSELVEPAMARSAFSDTAASSD